MCFYASSSFAADIQYRYGGRLVHVEYEDCTEKLKLDLERIARRVDVRGRLDCAQNTRDDEVYLMLELRGGGYALRVRSDLWLRVERNSTKDIFVVGELKFKSLRAKKISINSKIQMLMRY